MAHTLTDSEFGAIRVKRVHSAHHVRLKVTAEGVLVATLPKRASLGLVKRLVDESREELRRIVATSRDTNTRTYAESERVGASHSLRFMYGDVEAARAALRGQLIVITLPVGTDVESPDAQAAAKKGVIKALKKEATAYLPRQLAYLAQQYDFIYETVRYTNSKGRWGSCSSTGTISLNIALMNLPMEIIDYILVHELCHTREMNHSPEFWAMVEGICPKYKDYKRSLKDFTPYL